MSYYGLEDSSGHLIIEDGSGSGYLLEDATTFLVSDTLQLIYDITGVVSDTVQLLYDITGVVSDSLGILYDINGDASTQLVQQKKAITLPQLDVEFRIIEKTNGPYHYAAWLHLDNMASGDQIIIRVYKWDGNNSVYSLYEKKTISYSDLVGQENEDQTAVFMPFIPSERYKVTLEQSAGTLREFSWEMYQTS